SRDQTKVGIVDIQVQQGRPGYSRLRLGMVENILSVHAELQTLVFLQLDGFRETRIEAPAARPFNRPLRQISARSRKRMLKKHLSGLGILNRAEAAQGF